MSLKEYRRKRDFSRSREPQGQKDASVSGNLFVVQKHAARRLHYDLRLELDGVLKSWAVPRGPSLDPAQKRLAVQVEDHPVEYGAFEGTIPQGEYGGGTVMLWDRGTWEPEDDPREGLKNGKLSFRLHGQKPRGSWALARMKARGGQTTGNWLLIKHQDAEAVAEGNYRIVEAMPLSVATGRSLAEITAGAGEHAGPPSEANRLADPGLLTNACKAPQPASIKPQLATLVAEPPAGEGWLHEIKLDGYRIIAVIAAGRITLLSRHGKDWSGKFLPVGQALQALPVQQAILDGEIVVLRPDGTSDFQALQAFLESGGRTGRLVYYLFDLLHCNGYDLTGAPLRERKELLRSLIALAPPGNIIRFSDHIEGGDHEVFQQACLLAAEGVVSKEAASSYEQRRSRHWVKPQLVVEVAFQEWTRDKVLRMAAFKGLRRDKSPGEIVREAPADRSGDNGKPAGEARGRSAGDTVIAGVKVSHPDKVLYPGQGVTKRMLAQYYESIADFILPHVRHRPLTLLRCPEGHQRACFYQKHLREATPPALRTIPIQEKNKTEEYIVIDDLKGLISLVQMGVLEIHPWGCSEAAIEQPDLLCLDLDPGPGTVWPQIIEGARLLRQRLAEIGLQSFVKTSGGKGLHVVMPFVPRCGWDQAKAFARAVALDVVRLRPDLFVAKMSKEKRQGRIFIDYLRNSRGATTVAAYSTRARTGAPVSTPLRWDELDERLTPDRYRIDNLPRRLAALKSDPWQDFLTVQQWIPT